MRDRVVAPAEQRFVARGLVEQRRVLGPLLQVLVDDRECLLVLAALAVGLQLLVDSLVEGYGAVLVVARPSADPVPALRAAAAGLRMPGDR